MQFSTSTQVVYFAPARMRARINRMRFLDLTLPHPCRQPGARRSVCSTRPNSRTHPHLSYGIWEPKRPLVVIGRSSKIREEVHYDACLAQGVPVLRRASGGAAIVTGPGCLMYGLVLSFQTYPSIRAIDHAHRFVLSTIVAALRTLVPGVEQQGVCDLAFDDHKFSGNSVRSKQKNLLYHGTILYNFPLPLIDRFLSRPPREPDYRRGRPHGTFVANLPAPAGRHPPRPADRLERIRALPPPGPATSPNAWQPNVTPAPSGTNRAELAKRTCRQKGCATKAPLSHLAPTVRLVPGGRGARGEGGV